MKRKSFTREFKEEAVELADRKGITVAARELGVRPANIQRWKAQENSSEVESVTDADLEKEVKRLRKENEYLRKINEVLKKSTAIFSQDHHPNSKL